MATPPNSPQPSAPAAPAATPLQWNYPFPGKGGKEISDPESAYAALSNMDDGFFPLGVNGFPHGGVHFGAQTANAVEMAAGVRCIADGEIVAYKLDFAYPHLNFTQDGKWAMYSTGFVLVRHRLTLPRLPNSTGEQPAGESHDIYSLYMHMADWATYMNDGKLDRPWWWQGVDAYRVGNKDRQRAPQGGSPGTSGAMVCTEPKAGKKAGSYTAGQHVGFLFEGSEVTIGEKRGKWGHIKAISVGGMISPTAGGIFGEEDNPVPWKHDDSATPNAPVTPEGDWGWVYLPDLQPKKEPVPVGEVVRPRVPIYVKAGTLMGQLGEYHDYERATPLPPVPKRQLLHLEVFADDGLNAFLAKSRERAAQLPPEQRTTLVINAGAKLLLPAASDGNLASLGQVGRLDAAPGSPSVGPWMKAQPMQKQPGSTKFLPVGAAVWIKREDQNRTPLGFLQFWRLYPLQIQRVADPAVGFDTSHTRGALDTQGNASRAVDDTGTAWWLVQFGTADGQTASGWVREKGHPGTQWVSPWAWPGFNIVDATGIQLTDAFKRNLAITGSANWKEQKEFEPSTQAVNGSPLLLKLEQTVSKLESGKHAGRVTARAMQAAMRTPWLAQELADVILRYESEWGNNMARWEAITPLMRNARENWQCELQRIKKLQWWNDVKRVPGFPASPVVNHIHPIALVGNFVRSTLHPVITIRGERTELQFLLKTNGRSLEDRDYANAATELGCEVNAVKAVAKTETGSSGPYFRPGQDLAREDDPVPAILFERHLFHRATHGKYDQSHPRISNSMRGGYGTKAVQYEKLMEAYELDKEAALLSASWGRFQILGNNFKAAGFQNVRDYVAASGESEASQLRAFISFIKSDPVLKRAICNKDWHSFAIHYNGPAQQGYDATMDRNYKELSGK